jgi:multicomponent Na+:H+ antiporter subunit B
MLSPSESVIIFGVTRLIVPFIQIFGLYVIFHGHYSPGGGFQGGALLAASIFLERIVLGKREALNLFPIKLGLPLGIAGLLIYTLVGTIGLQGFTFLDYAALPFAMGAAELRAFGILLIEIGVGFAVLGTLVAIFDQIVWGGRG